MNEWGTSIREDRAVSLLFVWKLNIEKEEYKERSIHILSMTRSTYWRCNWDTFHFFYFRLQHTKEEIWKNLDNRTTPNPIDFHRINTIPKFLKKPLPLMKKSHTDWWISDEFLFKENFPFKILLLCKDWAWKGKFSTVNQYCSVIQISSWRATSCRVQFQPSF